MQARYLPFFLLLFLPLSALAQSERIRDYNSIGWYVYEGDHAVGKRWEIHTEYQWRRVRFLRDWQQSLARLGVTYQLHPKVKLAAGYTSFVTHPYGEYPTAETGSPFPEHRLYQTIQLADTLGRLALEHRVRLEQRWVGELEPGAGRRVVEWGYQNRVRYQIAATFPLQGAELDDGEWYLNAFDELFIGFGKNVGSNVFNQNRISGGLGYRFQENLRVELNYLYQITQHAEPDAASGRPVFEFNHGFRLGVNFDISFRNTR